MISRTTNVREKSVISHLYLKTFVISFLSLFQACDLYVNAQEGYISGSITAQKRQDPNDASGFVFVECNITGTGEVFLGRAWGSYSRVIFMYTYMSSIIIPEGWFDWGKPDRERYNPLTLQKWWIKCMLDSSL